MVEVINIPVCGIKYHTMGKYMSGNTYNKFKPGMLTTKDAKGREIPVMEQIYVDYSNYIVDEGPVLLEKIMDSNLFIDKQYNFS